jgi:hypothetical protein
MTQVPTKLHFAQGKISEIEKNIKYISFYTNIVLSNQIGILVYKYIYTCVRFYIIVNLKSQFLWMKIEERRISSFQCGNY